MKKLRFAMRKNSASRLNNKSATKEYFEVNFVSNEEMFEEYENAQVSQLFNTPLAVAIYFQNAGRIEKLFLEELSKHHITIK